MQIMDSVHHSLKHGPKVAIITHYMPASIGISMKTDSGSGIRRIISKGTLLLLGFCCVIFCFAFLILLIQQKDPEVWQGSLWQALTGFASFSCFCIFAIWGALGESPNRIVQSKLFEWKLFPIYQVIANVGFFISLALSVVVLFGDFSSGDLGQLAVFTNAGWAFTSLVTTLFLICIVLAIIYVTIALLNQAAHNPKCICLTCIISGGLVLSVYSVVSGEGYGEVIMLSLYVFAFIFGFYRYFLQRLRKCKSALGLIANVARAGSSGFVFVLVCMLIVDALSKLII